MPMRPGIDMDLCGCADVNGSDSQSARYGCRGVALTNGKSILEIFGGNAYP